MGLVPEFCVIYLNLTSWNTQYRLLFALLAVFLNHWGKKTYKSRRKLTLLNRNETAGKLTVL